jgi:hypothetical protein
VWLASEGKWRDAIWRVAESCSMAIPHMTLGQFLDLPQERLRAIIIHATALSAEWSVQGYQARPNRQSRASRD